MSLILLLSLWLVTLVPRLLPPFIVDKISVPPLVGEFLNVIPYATLGALIFPGIIQAIPNEPGISLIGGAVAVVLSLLRVPLVFVVLASVSVVYVLL
jgi:branched-subunit amino acid transport protein